MKKVTNFIFPDSFEDIELDVQNLPVIQATKHPSQSRWTERKKIIMPLLQDSDILKISKFMGYDLKKIGELI